MLLAVLGLAACSATDPVPSPVFDGHYLGTRVSNDATLCGTSTLEGSATARVSGGRLTMPLFGPKAALDGTVGDDGRVRASGIWRTQTEHFPQVTVLNGWVKNDILEGSATNFRCRTRLHLSKVVPPARSAPVASSGAGRKPAPASRTASETRGRKLQQSVPKASVKPMR